MVGLSAWLRNPTGEPEFPPGTLVKFDLEAGEFAFEPGPKVQVDPKKKFARVPQRWKAARIAAICTTGQDENFIVSFHDDDRRTHTVAVHRQQEPHNFSYGGTPFKRYVWDGMSDYWAIFALELWDGEAPMPRPPSSAPSP